MSEESPLVEEKGKGQNIWAMLFGFEFAIGVMLAVVAVCFVIAIVAVIWTCLGSFAASLSTAPKMRYSRNSEGQLHVIADPPASSPSQPAPASPTPAEDSLNRQNLREESRAFLTQLHAKA